jgi:hypothetical protein
VAYPQYSISCIRGLSSKPNGWIWWMQILFHIILVSGLCFWRLQPCTTPFLARCWSDCTLRIPLDSPVENSAARRRVYIWAADWETFRNSVVDRYPAWTPTWCVALHQILTTDPWIIITNLEKKKKRYSKAAAEEISIYKPPPAALGNRNIYSKKEKKGL